MIKLEKSDFKIKSIKAKRNEEKIKMALDELYHAAKNKNKNLLDLSVKAAKEGYHWGN